MESLGTRMSHHPLLRDLVLYLDVISFPLVTCANDAGPATLPAYLNATTAGVTLSRLVFDNATSVW